MITIKRILPVAVIAALIIVPRAEGGQQAYMVQAIVGDVKIVAGGATKAAAEGLALGGGDTVVTGRNSMADIAWGTAASSGSTKRRGSPWRPWPGKAATPIWR